MDDDSGECHAGLPAAVFEEDDESDGDTVTTTCLASWPTTEMHHWCGVWRGVDARPGERLLVWLGFDR